ncbi:hypothetical protein Hdeb2414_s0005g00186311 [Helianthus debilis subsp. tardiflorus]
MGDQSEKQSEKQTNTQLHPVYTVTDITRKVRVLDGVKVTYSSWVKLFQLHARGYKVSSHIDGTPAPQTTDPTFEAWEDVDSIVLQWIYGTLSDDLLVRVLRQKSTTYEAWQRLSEIFLNNKGSRAAALEHEFTNTSLKSTPSLEAYCQRLKDLADQLADVDSPVSESRLVLQLVRGLPAEYDNIGTYINQTLPSWDKACFMLQLEQQRQSARDNNSTRVLHLQLWQLYPLTSRFSPLIRPGIRHLLLVVLLLLATTLVVSNNIAGPITAPGPTTTGLTILVHHLPGIPLLHHLIGLDGIHHRATTRPSPSGLPHGPHVQTGPTQTNHLVVLHLIRTRLF